RRRGGGGPGRGDGAPHLWRDPAARERRRPPDDSRGRASGRASTPAALVAHVHLAAHRHGVDRLGPSLSRIAPHSSRSLNPVRRARYAGVLVVASSSWTALGERRACGPNALVAVEGFVYSSWAGRLEPDDVWQLSSAIPSAISSARMRQTGRRVRPTLGGPRTVCGG